jgi:hypothetical protein
LSWNAAIRFSILGMRKASECLLFADAGEQAGKFGKSNIRKVLRTQWHKTRAARSTTHGVSERASGRQVCAPRGEGVGKPGADERAIAPLVDFVDSKSVQRSHDGSKPVSHGAMAYFYPRDFTGLRQPRVSYDKVRPGDD